MKRLIVAVVFCVGLLVIALRVAPVLIMTAGFVPLALGLLLVGYLVSRWVK
jgi:hypothetical protein